MAYHYKNELVFFDAINGVGLFYAPTLGICFTAEDLLIQRMKSFLADKTDFPEFNELLESACRTRAEVFDLSKVTSHYCHIALGLTENCSLPCTDMRRSVQILQRYPAYS